MDLPKLLRLQIAQISNKATSLRFNPMFFQKKILYRHKKKESHIF